MAVDFFKKHAWEPNEVDWHFLIIFDRQPQIEGLAKAYQPLLLHPGLHPAIPAQWLHLTLLRVGSVDVISEVEMNTVCQKIQQNVADLVIPELALGSPWVWSGSVCLRATPEASLKALFETIVTATTEVLGDKASKTEPFTPHVTLAYPKDTNDEAGIEKQLKQGSVEPMTFQPTELCLVKQRQTPPYYQWEVKRRIPLS